MTKRLSEILFFTGAVLVSIVIIATTAGGPRSTEAQVVRPRVVIEPSPTNPPSKFLGMLTYNNNVIAFKLSASSTEPIIISDISLAVSSTPLRSILSASSTLRNYALYRTDTNALLRRVSAPIRPGVGNPTMGLLKFINLGLWLGPASSTTLMVRVDVASQAQGAISDSHHGFTLPDQAWIIANQVLDTSAAVVGRGALTRQKIGVSGGPILGNLLTVYRNVLGAGLDTTFVGGRRAPSAEQEVGRFSLWTAGGEGRPTVQGRVQIYFTSTVRLSAPRVIRLYKDAILPANLIGTYTHPMRPEGHMEFANFTLARWEIGSTRVTPRKLIVTADTRDAVGGNSLRTTLSQLTWTDGVLPAILGPIELPLTGPTINY